MLRIENAERCQLPDLVGLVKDFRRVQVSRFPIDAEFRDAAVVFFDSRFPRNEKAEVGRIYRDYDKNGKRFWVVDSRLIDNTRFARDNPRKHQKLTADIKKVLKYTREYVAPLTPKEISNWSIETHHHQVGTWRYAARNVMRDLCQVERSDVMEELKRMITVGYTPHTNKFRELMDRGLAAWEEAMRRENRKVMTVHVSIYPDESVEVFCEDKVGYQDIKYGAERFDSMDQAPQCIQQAVAMLRMMDDKSFVPEVGTKINAHTYWVEVHPE